MAELQQTWLYIFLGLAAFVIVCVVCAAVFSNRPAADSSKSGAPEGRWQP